MSPTALCYHPHRLGAKSKCRSSSMSECLSDVSEQQERISEVCCRIDEDEGDRNRTVWAWRQRTLTQVSQWTGSNPDLRIREQLNGWMLPTDLICFSSSLFGGLSWTVQRIYDAFNVFKQVACLVGQSLLNEEWLVLCLPSEEPLSKTPIPKLLQGHIAVCSLRHANALEEVSRGRGSYLIKTTEQLKHQNKLMK